MLAVNKGAKKNGSFFMKAWEGGIGEWEGDEESSSLGPGHNQENILVA